MSKKHYEVIVVGGGIAGTMAAIAAAEDNQGISLMFILAGIDKEKAPPVSEIKKIWDENKIGYRGIAFFWHPRQDAAYMNVTEVEGLSGLDPWQLTEATIECRKQAWQVTEIFKDKVSGFENAYIEQTAPTLGVRETRRIHGQYILTVDDVFAGGDFPDVIARASCPVDVHGSENAGKGQYGHLEKSYGIPYRSLITNEISKLIVTGRPISADHIAHSSLRRMAPGFGLGEAAGVAAGMAHSSGDLRTLSTEDLRSKLEGYGAILEPEE